MRTKDHKELLKHPVNATNLTDAFCATSMRNHNLILIANTVATGNCNYSRADLARITGLNRSTLTRLVDQLIEFGIIRELDSQVTGSGRPAVPLAPAQHTYASIGISISKTHLEVCVIDVAGNVLAERYEQIENNSPTSTLMKIKEIIQTLQQNIKNARLIVVHATIAISGLTIIKYPNIFSSPNLNWQHVNLVEFYQLFETTLYLDNETTLPIEFIDLADAGAYAETYLRHKEGDFISNFLYIHTDSSIDTTLVKDQFFEKGYQHHGGRLGHVFVAPSKYTCSSGHTGCLETFAGKQALIRESNLPTTASISNFYAALSRNEKHASKAATVAAEKLGIALATFVNISGISIFIFDGIYSEIFDTVKDTIYNIVKERSICSDSNNIQIEKTISPRSNIAFGSAWHGMAQFLNDPHLWQKRSHASLQYRAIEEMPATTIKE